MPSFFQISKPFGELAGEGGGELTIARVGAARWREGWDRLNAIAVGPISLIGVDRGSGTLTSLSEPGYEWMVRFARHR
jgi:hypothetical protein